MSTIANDTDTNTRKETFHKATGYLKGILTGYADRKGYAYHSTKEQKSAFAAGFKLGGKGGFRERDITSIHILYNRIRNRPPHRGTPEKDALYGIEDSRRILRDFIGEDLALIEEASWTTK